MNKLKFIFLTALLTLCFSMTALAAEDEDSITTEVESFTEFDGNWEGEMEKQVEGIYNTNPNARAAMTGVMNLGKSGTNVVASYVTRYSNTVSKIGVKNVRLMYKTTLGIWNTIVTLDNRYVTNNVVYSGGFYVTGTVGRTYMLSGTHYYETAVSSQSKYNETEDFTF